MSAQGKRQEKVKDGQREGDVCGDEEDAGKQISGQNRVKEREKEKEESV